MLFMSLGLPLTYYPFNSFTKDFVCYHSSSRIVGIEYESYGLYHLRTYAHVSLVVNSASLIHAQLSHPSLARIQPLVPNLLRLSSFSCESCQLGKPSRSSFSKSVSRVSSPFALVNYDIWVPSHV